MEKRLDEPVPSSGEISQLSFHLLPQRQRAEVNPRLKRQACVVEVPADLAIEVFDGPQFLRIQQVFGNTNEALVSIDLDLGIADLARVTDPSEPNLHAHSLLCQVLAQGFHVYQLHWHGSHSIF